MKSPRTNKSIVKVEEKKRKSFYHSTMCSKNEQQRNMSDYVRLFFWHKCSLIESKAVWSQCLMRFLLRVLLVYSLTFQTKYFYGINML